MCALLVLHPDSPTPLTYVPTQVTLNHILSIEERITYEVNPDDAEQTLMTQEARVTLRAGVGMSYFENKIVSTIAEKAMLGRKAMDYVVCRIETELQDLARATKESLEQLPLLNITTCASCEGREFHAADVPVRPDSRAAAFTPE